MTGATVFDPTLLATFLMVARTRSFTEAGRRLGLGQPTVSQHIRRLEATAGRRLFARDTHSVTLTADGEAMAGFARAILDANDRALRHFQGTELRGRVRFGATEDFVQNRLADILGDFSRRHPAVDLELTVALSSTLYDLLDEGGLDLVLAKRRGNDDRGRAVRRERLVWIGRDSVPLDPGRPVALVLYPPPSISRAMTLAALDRAGLPWRVVCTSGGLSGLRAAALAGFGLMVQPESMIPSGLAEVRPAAGLPDLGEVEFVVVGAPPAGKGPAAALADLIVARNRDRAPFAAPPPSPSSSEPGPS